MQPDEISKNKGQHVVVITENVYRKGGRIFDAAANVAVVTSPEDEAALAEIVREKHPVAVVIGAEKYTGPLYASMKPGTLLARFGVGCDGVDFAKAAAQGLVVTNTPGVLESTVAELTVFLAGEVLRRVGRSNEQMVNGQWAPYMGRDLSGKTWAIVGFGSIGKKLSKILSFGFGLQVIACKRSVGQEAVLQKEFGVSFVTPDFAEAVRAADIVSIHVPANRDTYQFLNRERLLEMKPGAILVNTGRGSLVDEGALFDVLKDGRLGGAGLDVFEHEPYVPVHPDKDLRTLSNVVLVPHVGSATYECADRMAGRVLQNINAAIAGRRDQMDVKES